MSLLEVRDLRVTYPVAGGVMHAVDGVSLDLEAGDRLGVVGESGSGKTSLARALLRLPPPDTLSGSVRLEGRELLRLPEEEVRRLRWSRIALALQGSGSAFSPVHRMLSQMADPLREHLGLEAGAAAARVREAAAALHLDPALLDRYPHQLSGGEKQRAMLAMTVCGRPSVLIADEPTSGLDPVIGAAVLKDLLEVQKELGFALLVCSHNLLEVSRSTERTLVMYAGEIVETAASADLVERPLHPYSFGLVGSHPALNSARDLRGIRGLPPDPTAPPPGCRFHPRCTQSVAVCSIEVPRLEPQGGGLVACHLGGLQTVLSTRGLTFCYPASRARAVDGVDLRLRHGEVLAVVGESGSGKTTLARLLVGLLRPAAGSVWFGGGALQDASPELRRGLQMVFQDPFEAISSRLTAQEVVREPLDVQRLGSRAQRDARAVELIELVRLPATPAFLKARSHELSGGQLQRIGVARALALDPRVLVADEPASMLDGSEQANLLNLLKELQVARGLAMVLISHDIAAACRLADQVIVLRSGRVVERGSPDKLLWTPRDAYTRSLLAAARPAQRPDLRVEEEEYVRAR